MRRWFFYCLLAVVLWGAWAVIPKKLGEMPAFQQQAGMTLGLVPILCGLLVSKKVRVEKHKLFGSSIAFLAGILSGLGNLSYYMALRAGGGKVSVLAALTALYPVVVVLLAMMFLRERPSRAQGIGILLALVAIYLFNRWDDSSGKLQFAGGRVAFVAIAMWAISGTLQKVAADAVSGALATVYFLGAFLPLGGFLVVTQKMDWNLSTETWTWLVLLGLTFGLGNWLYLAACNAGAKASVAAPLSGLYPLVAVPLAVTFFNEKIGWREGAGIAVAALAVVGLAQERKQPGKEPAL